MSSDWTRLAGLPLVVESVDYATVAPPEGFDAEAHPTRLVRLHGAGETGLAEDITAFIGGPPPVDLAGEWDLDTFCRGLDSTEQWPDGAPEFDMARRWRNWAYESAALDLALRQAGVPLHEALGREPRPIAYVNSLGLGEPASTDTILRRLDRYPGLRFKLDAAPDWDDAIVATLVGTGAVHTVDFKGRYDLEVKDLGALVAMYERVLDAFPTALLEDPHDLPEIAPLVAPHADRVSYDAPVATVADVERLDARTYNVKPSRIGHLRELFAIYAECERRGAALYGGGMGELDVARGQIQLLASLYHPDGPNDIAPSGFNALDPAAGMEPSPLQPRPAATGFRRA